MAAVIAALLGLLILTALIYDITRLCGCDEPRSPPLARLRGQRVAWEAAGAPGGPAVAPPFRRRLLTSSA